ncbi:hypothetical protein EDD18DRAFT_1081952 [Armillaria luteobubalina]|uniref:Uncharacterized protein n=1 Tax=Armillaria luteobubalina TaxID=153913 RepID=A0AA39PPB4_9AGAR|nr:hypothetical protein EDD18DRAFT_1081952 [Armillaria luteobubalina]
MNGKVKVTASEWPSFLYDQDLYDPMDDEVGLMKGYLLLHVCAFLMVFYYSQSFNRFTYPYFAAMGSIAKINGIQLVSGCQIAYAACQACYVLSSKDGWTEQDGAFDMMTFYNSIVALFESFPDDEWCLHTLAWWNKYVPCISD